MLETDDRVLARVTDGIYRQPASALRELISNSYDADASRVVISTDRPRFSQIRIEDDGIGMTPEALAHLLKRIGGSAKRNPAGAGLGITAQGNPDLSPSGRRLIGKIGIGLFSVSQLTHSFQIITKTKGDPHRTVATVALKQYSDESASTNSTGEKYETGRVAIWREAVADIDSSGTTVVLTDIRPQTRDTLRSVEVWRAIDASESMGNAAEKRDIDPPRFHIGWLTAADGDLLRHHRVDESAVDALPWGSGEAPNTAFKKLVDAVWKESDLGTPNPKLDIVLDYYLRMVWQLSLSAPLPYVDGNPFDMQLGDAVQVFRLPESLKEAPKEVELDAKTIREALDLGTTDDGEGFSVFVDDLQLYRPLRFRNLPTTGHALKRPMFFVGQQREEFKDVEVALSGGPLEFQAYLMWTPKVVPTDHRGALIRIHGSSGTLFDPDFLKYQVSELTRLSQITCEIFVSTGLEGALNIDRESFNYAHPHVVYLTNWLHAALRRLASTQKRVAGELRQSARTAASESAGQKLRDIAVATWRHERDDADGTPPPVDFPAGPGMQTAGGEEGGYRFDREAVFGRPVVRPGPALDKTLLEDRMKAIAQVLASFGVLDDLSRAQRETLMGAIREILETEG